LQIKKKALPLQRFLVDINEEGGQAFPFFHSENQNQVFI